MITSMRYRGTDSITVRSLPDNRAAIGAATVNLTPYRTESASVAAAPYIVFDGELFNERSEGQTDLQLFEEYYRKYGKACFKYLDGSFCCAVVGAGPAWRSMTLPTSPSAGSPTTSAAGRCRRSTR